jgi:curli biogenesis system outer membrane secretion channel CsgG
MAAMLAFMGNIAVAGSCKVNKDNITFTPASNMGTYIISAPPGTVAGIHPIKVVCLDKDTAEKFEAAVNPDGSFTLTVDGTQGDKIKLKFTDSSGSKTRKTLRIPIMSQKSLLDGPQKVVDRKGEAPGGPGAPKLAAPSEAVAPAGGQTGAGPVPAIPPAGEEAPPAAGGGAAASKAAGPLSLKKIVAVAEFKNKANVPSRFNLGSGMQAQLVNALNRSGKFVVREQELLKDVFGEQDLAQSGRMAESKSARIGKAITAQYLVRGTVTEYDAAEVSDSKGFSIHGVSISGGKSRAHMACIIDLIDTTSGTVIASQRMEGKAEGRGAGGGLSLPYVPGGHIRHGKQKHTPVNKAMQMCIDNCVYFIIQELAKQPWRSTIVKADESRIIIRGGKEDGMQPGYEFSVYRQGDELRDPTTGELLDVETKKIGRISVTKVKKKIAYAKPLMGSGFQAGDLVKVD